jgi:hypothetical protein
MVWCAPSFGAPSPLKIASSKCALSSTLRLSSHKCATPPHKSLMYEVRLSSRNAPLLLHVHPQPWNEPKIMCVPPPWKNLSQADVPYLTQWENPPTSAPSSPQEMFPSSPPLILFSQVKNESHKFTMPSFSLLWPSPKRSMA